MTAINCFRVPGRGIMMTDTALYTADARVVGFAVKAVPVERLKAVVAVRGPQVKALAFAETIWERYEDFDDLLDRFEADCRGWYKASEAMLLADPWQEHQVIVLGWSDRESSPKILSFTSAPSMDECGVFETHPVFIDHMYDPSEERNLKLLRSRAGVDFNAQSFDPLTHGINIMEAQRRTKESAGENESAYIVGGSITLTEVTAEGVSQRTVHEWNDVEGEFIQPAPFSVRDKPVGARLPVPEGLNRAERRRLAKLSKKRAA